jgi:hypothetical protein
LTIRDLDRLTQPQQITENEDNKNMIALLQKLKNKSFYNWDSDHRNVFRAQSKCCCFNHILGMPKKGNKEYPLFDYEHQVFRALTEPGFINSRKATEEDNRWYEEQKRMIEQRRVMPKNESLTMAYTKLLKERDKRLAYPQKIGHLLVLKSAGLGLTTLLLRYIAWNCLKDDSWKDTDVVILTGPRQELSNDLITRLKQLFLSFGITFDTKVSTLILNGVRVRAFPSDHLSAARGIPSVSMIYCDEASFSSNQSQSEVIDVIERYAGKSNAQIVLTSTPNKVGDLMHTILAQPFEESFYKILKLNYEWGVGKIYSEEDIKIAKMSSSFEREYNLSFNSPSGNCFSHSSIDRTIELSKKYPDIINKEASHSLGVDPGFGSSSFALVCLEHSDSIIKVCYAKQFERSSFNDMVQEVWNIRNLVGSLDNVYIDQSNVEFIEAVKQDFGENSNWQYIHETIAHYKKMNSRIENIMKVIPVSFGQEGASMLVHCKNLLEHEDNLIAISPKHEKLIAALKGAVSREYKLDKTESPYNDLTDAFRLAAKYFRLEK